MTERDETFAEIAERLRLNWDRRAPSQAEPLMRLINCIESCEDVNLSGIDRDLIVYALARTLSLQDHAVPVDQWKIVADEPVLIYVVHTNAEFEKDEKVRREKWECWTVGRWITHNHGGWTYYGMMGKVTHVAPLPAAPAMVAEERGGE